MAKKLDHFIIEENSFFGTVWIFSTGSVEKNVGAIDFS